MPDPVQLQDSSKSFVVPFGNRKAGQNYFFQDSAASTKTSSSSLSSMSKGVKDMFGKLVSTPSASQSAASVSDADAHVVSQLASSSIIILPAKKQQQQLFPSGLQGSASTSNATDTSASSASNPFLFLPSTSYPMELYLPTRDAVCLMYLCYLVLMGLVNLLLPYYTFYMAIMLCPLFTVSVLSHCVVLYSFWNTMLGVVVCILYPLVVIFSMFSWPVSVFVVLMLVFCNLAVVLQTSYPAPVAQSMRYLHACAYVGLSISCLVGILTFQVYPQSIYGLHAAVLALACLCCASLIMAAKTRMYRVVAEAPPVTVKAAMTDLQI